jgi:YHS domain-containing protein
MQNPIVATTAKSTHIQECRRSQQAEKRGEKMTSLICPTCGCSLVRLGIRKDKSSTYSHDGRTYYFCCQGCIDEFVNDPEKYLGETSDLVVCPTCLAEKAVNTTVALQFADQEFRFCRCPSCLGRFKRDPDYYIERLKGSTAYPGVFGKA